MNPGPHPNIQSFIATMKPDHLKLTALLLLCLSFLPKAECFSNERLNVLFIAVDDMRVELGCYGNTQAISPHIDALAKRGTLFTRAYCQQAVCNPSRASLLTGLRPSTLGIWNLQTHFRQVRKNIITLPQLFKNNGYFAQGIGKIFHNWRQDDFKGDRPSWSVPQVMHYNSHGRDKAQVQGKLPPNHAKTPRCEIRDVPDEAYFDGRIANLAVDALKELKDNKQPFFLAVGFWKPHAHFNAPKKYWDLYKRSDIQLPKNPDHPKNVPPIALHNGREINNAFKNRPAKVPTPKDAVALRHGYYAAISYVDRQVGKVIEELDRLDLAKNTVIVFWSDHGFHLGENGLWAKTSNFELDARVPLIIASPQHSANQRTNSLAELLDLYPTLVELCQLPRPNGLEGKSLVPVLNSPSKEVKPTAFTWHPRPAYPNNITGPEAMGYSMRTGRYRYTEWRQHPTAEVIAQELYDHEHDPLETHNRAYENENKSTIDELKVLLRKTHPQRIQSLYKFNMELKSFSVQKDLPDPFIKPDGTRLTKKSEWNQQRNYFRELLLYYQYGTIPQAPIDLKIELLSEREILDGQATLSNYRLHLNPYPNLKLQVGLTLPKGEGPFPVIIKNESRLGPHPPILKEIIQRGYALCEYVNADLDPDKKDTLGPAQAQFPDHDWGTLAVWAWGGIRTVDFLMTQKKIDQQKIIVTGHSRGGKTALLHGALDRRVALVNTNGSGAGGSGSYRAQGPRSETLELITQPKRFGYWFGPRFRSFADQESKLPFDQHFLAALIAPRALLATEAKKDLWASPSGTQETIRAAREIYNFFGASRKVGMVLREGKHNQNAEDWRSLLDFSDIVLRNKKDIPKERFYEEPFPDLPRKFSWKAPKG